jgi:uncharacterized protein (DUF697 family)/tellurite resistance protein
MPIAETEAVASLKILVAVARADGTVHHDERKSLAAALESLELPSGITVESLLAENVDVKAELGELLSNEAREQIYRSAYFMAYADGECTKEEQAILDEIAMSTGVTPEQKAALARLFVGSRPSTGVLPTKAQRIDDPARRASEVQKQIVKYGILTAVLGAFPIPGLAIATDLAVIAMQLKMIRDLGAYWGHTVDRNAAKSILYGVGLGTGARLAVNNLAKLIPGWGSAIGATTSFASTYALGKVMQKFFDAGATDATALEGMKDDFKAAEKEGKEVYAEQKDAIVESQREHKTTIAALTSDLEAGKITQEEFDRRVADLA